MSLFNQRLSRVKCAQCKILIPLRQWKEHSLQHASLRVLKLSQYPRTFLCLTQHFINELALLEEYNETESIRHHLVTAYDTLKMLYFKNYHPRPATAPPSLLAFDNMEDSMPVKDYNYSTNLDPEAVKSPWPFSYSVSIEQFSAGIYHCEQPLKETQQAFFTDYGNTPVPDDNKDKGSLWGCAMYEGLSGSFAARAASKETLDHIKSHLARNLDPSHQDIRKALQHALHKVDVSLKQGHNELGQSRWSGVTGCLCVLQSAPEISVYLDTDLVVPQQGHGALHISNIGNIVAVLSREGQAKRVSYLHSASDRIERTRIVECGGYVSANGQINAVTSVTRALGFHGDTKLRKCLSRKPYTSSIILQPGDEYLIIGNWRLWRYLGEEEAVGLCKTLLTPSTKKLIHIFSQLPDNIQEDILSSKSTMDYDQLVSDFGDFSMDSSMEPENESEKNFNSLKMDAMVMKFAAQLLKPTLADRVGKEKEKELDENILADNGIEPEGSVHEDQDVPEADNAIGEMDWKTMFNDPLANLNDKSVCQLLSETMSNSLVTAARDAGAVGPLSCVVILLPGALPAARKRLLFEQVVYELMKRYDDRYNISEVSLLSFTDGMTSTRPCDVQTESIDHEDSDLIEFKDEEVEEPPEPVVADQLQLEDDNLFFKDCGVLLLKPGNDNNIHIEHRPDIRLDTALTQASIEEQRGLIRDMVSIALQKTEEQPEISEYTPQEIAIM